MLDKFSVDVYVRNKDYDDVTMPDEDLTMLSEMCLELNVIPNKKTMFTLFSDTMVEFDVAHIYELPEDRQKQTGKKYQISLFFQYIG